MRYVAREWVVRGLVGLGLAGAIVLAGCGGDGDSEGGATATNAPSSGPAAVSTGGLPVCAPLTGEAPRSKDFPPSSDPARNIPEEQRKKINVVVAGADFYVGDNNIVFGVTNLTDEPEGGAKTRATLYDLRDPANPKPYCQVEAVQGAPGIGPKTTHEHADGAKHEHGGEEDNRVGYFFRANLDHAGGWGLAVEAVLKDGTKGTASVGFQATAKSAVLSPGAAAYKSDNLTKKDVKNISEIDSGEPPNDMHDVKIKDAIAKGRPLVVVFSTPAFCQSRFCGPVTEEVEDLHDDYKDKVDFVHIEIYRDFQANKLNPTATEWLTRPDGRVVEPYVFIIDKAGTIYDRFEGPVARNIMEPSVKAVAEGKTYR